jgi:hypothetical protein
MIVPVLQLAVFNMWVLNIHLLIVILKYTLRRKCFGFIFEYKQW